MCHRIQSNIYSVECYILPSRDSLRSCCKKWSLRSRLEVQECRLCWVKHCPTLDRYLIKLWAVMEATCNMFAHLVETKMIVIGQNVSVQEYTLILSDTNENEFQVIFYPSNHTNYNVSMMWPRGRKLGLDVWELYVCRLQCRHECWWCRFGQPISNQHFDHLSFNL